MSLAWSSVKALSIPVGGVSRDVKRVTAGGVTLWRKLPYDAKVEYIESTGTQYIDTGFAPTSTSGLLLDFVPLVASGSSVVVGSRTSGTNSRFWVNPSINSAQQTLMTVGFGQYTAFSTDIWSVGTRYEIAINYLNSRTANFQNETRNLDSLGFSGNPYSVYIFCANVSGTASFVATSTMKLYGLRITNGSSIVRDYIPVRVGSGSSAVGCLYDRLGAGGQNPDGTARNDGLYFNRGSGAFVVGPDKTP